MKQLNYATALYCRNGHDLRDHLYVTNSGQRSCGECRRQRERLTRRDRRKVDATHCAAGHELAGDNLYMHPNGRRYCRECRKDDYAKARDAARVNAENRKKPPSRHPIDLAQQQEIQAAIFRLGDELETVSKHHPRYAEIKAQVAELAKQVE